MSTPPQPILDRLSAERVGPYLRAANDDPALALALYEWNTAVSGAFFETLQAFEVVLRNALVKQLQQWHGDRRGNWYDDPDGVFDNRTTNDVAVAIERVQDAGYPLTAGRVVAELSFSFWRYLLTKRYTDDLWIPHLRHAFANAPQSVNRTVVDAQVAPLVRLRNRIAHHEPIFTRDLPLDAKRALGVAGWICNDTQRWMMRCSRIPDLLDQRPGVTR